MGLDMYLNRWPRVSGIDYALVLEMLYANRKVPTFVTAGKAPGKPYYGDFNLEAATGIEGSNVIMKQGKYANSSFGKFFNPLPEVGYWRKADDLHAWFVGNVQGGVDDCGFYEVSKEQLEQLLWDIQAQIDKAHRLPDSPRPAELNRTKRILNSILKKTNWDIETIVYHASW